MNLVLSGPIDDTLRNLVIALTHPRCVVPLHARADRLEGANDEASIRTQVAALCDAARVDHAYIEEGLRFADFKLLAMDMDSTLITIECIDEIADFAGKKAEVAAITEAAMRGELDFAESLRRRVAALAGTDVAVLETIYAERLKITAGARDVIRTAKRAGLRTVLLSGGFDYFANRLKTELGLDAAHANRLASNNQHLTGGLQGRLVDAETKAALVEAELQYLQCTKDKAIVIGDGANDINMMKCVEHSVAYRAKRKTRDAAKYRINYGDFTVLLDWVKQ